MTRTNVVNSIQVSMAVRIAYIRLHMYTQRQADQTTTLARSPWEVIDCDLEALRRKSPDYKTM